MKPTTEKALELVSRSIGACPQSFLEAGVGVRYGARLHELRQAGYVIERKPRCDIHSHPRATESYHLYARPGEIGQMEIAL